MTSPIQRRRRESLTPALAAAAALHVAVFAIALWSRPSTLIPVGAAVPITIVAQGPTTDSRPAEAAPVTQTAQSEDPVPRAKAPAPPPVAAPRPKPAPPQKRPPPPPKPAPTPTPKPLAQKPAAKPTPVAKPAPDTFSLDALAAKIAHTSRPSPPRPSSGARGPTRAETASVARVDAGQGVSQSDVAGLSQLLERLWNPNCIAAEGAGVVIPVKFAVGEDGRVVGRITEGGRDGAADEVVATAARRAIDAVHQAEPYGAAYRGKSFTVNFDAKTACANR